jgi:hypothetical protein
MGLVVDYERLWTIADLARAGCRLTPDDNIFVREVAPKVLQAFPKLDLPKRARHPAGFAVSGAPVGTFLRSGLLLAGQKVFGRRYEGSRFYQDVEKDLAFGIMRRIFIVAIRRVLTVACSARWPCIPFSQLAPSATSIARRLPTH